MAAAVSARSLQATVFLAESHSCLGGMGTAARVPVFMTLSDGIHFLPGGFGQRVVDGLKAESTTRNCKAIDAEALKRVYDGMMTEAGADFTFYTTLIAVQAQAGRVEHVVCASPSGLFAVRAKVYIDATGNGDLAAWAGAPAVHFAAGDPGAYSAGFTFRLCNVDLQALEADLERRGAIRQLAHAVKPHTAQPDLVRLGIDVRRLREQGIEGPLGGFLSSSVRPREITYCNCVNYGPNDGLDPDALSAAETDLRERMLAVADMFRRHLAGCEGCYPAGAAPAAGQRRARAIRAEYDITQEDCTSARRFDDAVACFSFIDNPHHFVREAGYYQIPYRALLPQGVDNLLMAGRMMTVETVAHNSTRNTVCCMICGQAAGTAAALAVAAGQAPRALDVAALQARLRADGVLLEAVPEPL